MALSNQTEFLAFFTRRQVNLKNSHRILPKPTIPEDYPTRRDCLIPEDDLPRTAKSLKMAYREWPNPSLRQAGFGQARYISYHDLVSLASQYVNLRRGFDETRSLKPSSGDKRFQLVVSRNG
jgi:hypothetical protein